VSSRLVADDNTSAKALEEAVEQHLGARVANISLSPSGMLDVHRKPLHTRIFGFSTQMGDRDALTCVRFRCFT
jgi:hypothetical protein